MTLSTDRLPTPPQFGLPTQDDGSRDDALMGTVRFAKGPMSPEDDPAAFAAKLHEILDEV